MGAAGTQRPAGQVQGASSGIRYPAGRSRKQAPEPGQIKIPPGPRLGDLVIDATDVTKAFGDKLLMENVNFKIPKGAIVGIIGPNGAGKTTLFRMITGQESPIADDGDRRDGQARLRRSEPRIPGGRKNRLGKISGGHDVIEIGKHTVPSRAMLVPLISRAPISRKRSGNCPAVNAIVCTWRRC